MYFCDWFRQYYGGIRRRSKSRNFPMVRNICKDNLGSFLLRKIGCSRQWNSLEVILGLHSGIGRRVFFWDVNSTFVGWDLEFLSLFFSPVDDNHLNNRKTYKVLEVKELQCGNLSAGRVFCGTVRTLSSVWSSTRLPRWQFGKQPAWTTTTSCTGLWSIWT